jgi:hypothetical protein
MWSSAPPALCVTLLWVGRNPWYWTSLSKESLCLSLFLTFTLKSPLRIVRNWYNMRMHGQPRYQIWIKCDKRQMTSCVHKMCGQTYGQTNMKRATKYGKNVTKDKWLVAYTRCADRRMVKQTWNGLLLSQKSTIREIGIICPCSDHGQPRYQIWIKSNKRQMTSYIHKV